MKLLISNIQRFCLHDGPGIRTTIFFMGCPLKCFWCCNPENMTKSIKKFIKNGVPHQYGKEYSEDELYEIILRDKTYYEDCGGVTFSGGEVLLYLKDSISLLERLKQEGISIAIETSLVVPKTYLEPVIPYIDYFIVDIKCLTSRAIEINIDVKQYLDNLNLLKGVNSLVMRMPVVNGFNDDEENITKIKEVIKKIKPHKFEIFSVHNLSESKYHNLGMAFNKQIETSHERLEEIIKYIDFDNSEIIHL